MGIPSTSRTKQCCDVWELLTDVINNRKQNKSILLSVLVNYKLPYDSPGFTI